MSKKLTTSEGQPVANNQNSQTAGRRGPVLIQDVHLLEKLAHFNRERIPERVVHAKGAGAFGEFELTNDMSAFTKAGLFNGVGKKTKVAVRFSQVAGEAGYIDTYRDVRGFAVKFYTEEGNYDIVGNNTPVFFVNDPLKFPDFIHSQKRDPKTHLRDPYMQWDFWSHSPESVHQVTILMADRGIPASYRTMHGYGSHTYKWVNQLGEVFWIKYHFRTNQGVKNLTDEVAAQVASENTDYLMDELVQAIEKGDYPSWTLCVQIIPFEEGLNYKYDLFDVTKVVSQKDYPLIEVGTMTLNQNPQNYFTDVEELAFSPANLVPGIEVSPDKLLQGRLFAYKDAARYRLGVNYTQLPINQPINEVNTYQRDGLMQSNQSGDAVNYEPNSQNGPVQDESAAISPFDIDGQAGTYDYPLDHYSQAGDLYRLLPEEEKERLIQTIKTNLGQVNDRQIHVLEIKQFYLADKEYGSRVAEALMIPIEEIQS